MSCSGERRERSAKLLYHCPGRRIPGPVENVADERSRKKGRRQVNPMSSRRDQGHEDLFHPANEMDEVFARANPNPERKGCPSDDVLKELAHRRRPISDPGYEHLAHCSPCYRIFRRFQQEAHQQEPRARGGVTRWLAAAAILLLIAAGIWFAVSWRRSADGGGNVVATEVRAEMDLRKYAIERNDVGSPNDAPLAARRAKLDLTILLPVGSEAGIYELQVMDAELRSKAAGLGEAQLENHVTTLRTNMDLRSLTPGIYKLALRRRGEDWRFFPLQIE